MAGGVDRGWEMGLRLLALGLVALLVELELVSQINLLGVTADLTPLIVVSVGLLLGSEAGAIMGFCMGLLIDMALHQDLGVSSLVLTGVGYGGGRLREVNDPAASGLVPLAAGAGATAVAAGGYALVQFLLGVDAPVSLELLRQILATVLVNAAIALPVYALVRRALGRTMPSVPRRRRRPGTVSGPLSPLSGGGTR